MEQYKREQRSEFVTISTLFEEGMGELKRRLQKLPMWQVYIENDIHKYITPLEAVVDSLAWKDQAKELIRLSSSVYNFEDSKEKNDWHDKPGCWIGTNIKTQDLVCLYPVQSTITISDLNKLIAYLEKIQTSLDRKVGEIIVAAKNEFKAIPQKQWQGISIRFETESSLLDNLVDFKDYENDIFKRVTVNRLTDSDLTLSDVYVPSRCKHARTNITSKNIEQYLTKWLAEPGQRQIALLGEYGQGKSTATLMLTYKLLLNPSITTRKPILIELRGRSPRNQSRLGLL